MNITLNNKEITLSDGTTLQELILEQNLPTQNIAVAVNNTLILHDKWCTTSLSEGDKVVAIVAAYGG